MLRRDAPQFGTQRHILAALATPVSLRAARLHDHFTSPAVEAQRIASANLMFQNIGRLMEKFFALPVKIEDYFDTNYIRDGTPPPRRNRPRLRRRKVGSLREYRASRRAGRCRLNRLIIFR